MLIGRRAQLVDLIAEFGGAFIVLSCHCQGKLLFQITDGLGFRFAFFGPFRSFPVMVGIRLDLGKKREDFFFKDVVAFTAAQASYVFVILKGEGADWTACEGQGLQGRNGGGGGRRAFLAELALKVREQFLRQIEGIWIQQTPLLGAFGAKAEFGGLPVDDLCQEHRCRCRAYLTFFHNPHYNGDPHGGLVVCVSWIVMKMGFVIVLGKNSFRVVSNVRTVMNTNRLCKK